jgi:hypothetical protein
MLAQGRGERGKTGSVFVQKSIKAQGFSPFKGEAGGGWGDGSGRDKYLKIEYPHFVADPMLA